MLESPMDPFELSRRRWSILARAVMYGYFPLGFVACFVVPWSGYVLGLLSFAWVEWLFGGSENDRPWRTGWRDRRRREAELRAWLEGER